MAATLHTSKIEIPWTNIITAGQDRDIVVWSEDELALFFGLNADAGLFGHGYEFTANFRVIEASTNQTFNHYWTGKLDGFQAFAPNMWLSMTWAKAAWAGVSKSHYSFFGSGVGDGLYLYRPYFLVHAGVLDVEFVIYSGKSEFAVADEHYFMVESSM